MSVPKRFDRRLKTGVGLRAVWLPGDRIDLGDVLQRQDGIFQPIGNLSDFGVTYRKQRVSKEVSLTFQSRGVSTTIVQGGAEVDVSAIDAGAKAEVKIDFQREETYYVRTPQLGGVGIDNLLDVGRRIRDIPAWRHGRYFVAWRIYEAEDFVFLGSRAKNRTVKFGGSGNAILEFLTLGLSAGVTRVSQSSVSYEILGKGGPVAQRVARVKKSGEIEFV